MKSVKKNKDMRRMLGIAALVIVTLSLLGGTLAKYTDIAEVDDSARVAKFNISKVGKKNHLFQANSIYDNWEGTAPKFEINVGQHNTVDGYKDVNEDLIILLNDEGASTKPVELETDIYPPDKDNATPPNKENIIAPGTSGYAVFNFSAKDLEVKTEYTLNELTITNVGNGTDGKIPLEYSYALVKNGEVIKPTTTPNTTLQGLNWTDNENTFITGITGNNAITGELVKDEEVQLYIFWRWQYEKADIATNDATDTNLGKKEGIDSKTSTVTIKATTSLTQVD